MTDGDGTPDGPPHAAGRSHPTGTAPADTAAPGAAPADTPAPGSGALDTAAPAPDPSPAEGDGEARRPWVVGVSGASGTPFAAAVLRGLLAAGEAVDLVVSRASRLTLLDETGISFRDAHWRRDLYDWLTRGADGKPGTFAGEIDPELPGVRHWPAGDLAAGPSSGSYPVKGMVVVPASTACVAGVALGLSKDLLQRAAGVTLKERRPLVVAVRETPLNGPTLRHLVSLDDAGAVVLPASPAFYAGATHIQDLVDFVAGRVLDAVGVPHGLYRRWDGQLGHTPGQS